MFTAILFLNDPSRKDAASSEYDDLFFQLTGVVDYAPTASDTMALFRVTKKLKPEETMVFINNPNYLTFNESSDKKNDLIKALIDKGVPKDQIHDSLPPIEKMKEVLLDCF